jgi:hypothetical protein
MPSNNAERGSIQQENPGFGLEIDRFKNVTPEEIARHLIYYSREVRNACSAKRTNPVVINEEKLAELADPESNLSTTIATVKIYEWFKKETPAIKIWTKSPTPSSEEILLEMLPFVDFCPGSIMIWISGKGEVYEDARVNLYQAIEVNGEKRLFFWSIPTENSDQECLEAACRLSPHVMGISANELLGITKDIETLRITPLPIWEPDTKSLTEFFSEHISLPEVWPQIRSGQILMEAIRELLAGQKGLVTNEVYQRIMAAQTYWEKVMIGSELEIRAMIIFGIELLSHRHGMLHLDALAEQSLGLGIGIGANRFLKTSESVSRGEYFHCGRCKSGKVQEGETCPSNPPKWKKTND